MATKRSRTTDTRTARRMRRSYARGDWQDVCAADVDAFGASGGSHRSWFLDPGVFRDHVLPFIATTSPTSMPAYGLNLAEFEEQLVPLRGVCRTWYIMAGYLLADAKKQKRTLIITDCKSSDLQKLTREAKRDASMVTDLMIDTQERYDPLPKQWWSELFASYPNLIRLKLRDFDIGEVGEVIATASEFMPRLEFLSFRSFPNIRNSSDIDKRVVLDRIVNALQKWHSINGGLKAIPLPLWIMSVWQENDWVIYNDYMAAIATYCPRLERFPVDSYCYPTPAIKPEALSEDVWAAFCRSCTSLREYSVLVAPVTPAHVQMFIKEPKADLEELHFVSAGQSQWGEPENVVIIEDMIKISPKLVSIKFDLSRDYGYPSSDSLNHLICTVGQHCRLLKQFRFCFRERFKNQPELNVSAMQSLVHANSKLDVLDLVDVDIAEELPLEALLHHFGRCRRRSSRLLLSMYHPVHTRAYQTLQFLAREFHTNPELTIQLQRSRELDKLKMIECGKQCRVELEDLTRLVDAIHARHTALFSYLNVHVCTFTEGDQVVHVIHHFQFRTSRTKFDHCPGGLHVVLPEDSYKHSTLFSWM